MSTFFDDCISMSRGFKHLLSYLTKRLAKLNRRRLEIAMRIDESYIDPQEFDLILVLGRDLVV